MEPLLRLRVVASKQDNPWLDEDIVARPGVCIKMAPAYSLADLDRDEYALSSVRGSVRAILRHIRERR